MPTLEKSKWQPYGPVYFAPRDETVTPARPGVFGDPLCADQLSMALSIDYTTHDSKCGAVVAEDFRQVKKAGAEITIQLADFSLEAMILALLATDEDADASPVAVVDEELTEIPDEGGTIALGGSAPNFNITSLSIEDSATVPATLVADTDYTYDAQFGMVTFDDLSSFTQPLKASYSHANPVILAALAAGQLTRWVRFNGVNRARSSKIVPVDVFQMQISPTSGFDLMPDDLGKLDLKGSLLIDQSRPSTDVRGQFFSIGREA